MTEQGSLLTSTISDLVTANHILVAQGILDAFGHVSVRHPERSDRFLLSRNRAPALVSAEDILEFYMDAAPVDANAPPVYLERFLHAALYRGRADIGAVVHSHSRSVLPFGASKGTALQPISHMAGFLGAGVPLFEIRDHAGSSTDMLIRDNALGDALAEALGAADVILMRGHGVTVAGRDVRQAVFHAVYTEWNATVQAGSMAIGEPVFMTAAEAAAAEAANRSQIARAWEYWAMRATNK